MEKQRRLEDIMLIEEACGPRVARMLIKRFGGMRLYIPCGRYFTRELKRRYIRDKFNGRNHKYLATETGYSLRRIYEIIKRF